MSREKRLERKRLACSLEAVPPEKQPRTVALQSSMGPTELLIIRRRLITPATAQLLHQFLDGRIELAIAPS
jgi:hypothetical protein